MNSESLKVIKKKMQFFLTIRPLIHLWIENNLIDPLTTELFFLIRNSVDIEDLKKILSMYESLIFFHLFRNSKKPPSFSQKFENLLKNTSYSVETKKLLKQLKTYKGIKFSFISASDIILKVLEKLVYKIPDCLPDSKFKKMVLKINPRKELILEASPIYHIEFNTFQKMLELNLDILSEERKLSYSFFCELLRSYPDFLNAVFELNALPLDYSYNRNSSEKTLRVTKLEETIKFGRIDIVLKVGGKLITIELSGYNKTHSSDGLKYVLYEDSVFSDFLRMYSFSVGNIPSFVVLTDVKNGFIEYRVIYYSLDLIEIMKSRSHEFSELYFYCQNPFILIYLEKYYSFKESLAGHFNVKIDFETKFFKLLKLWRRNKKDGVNLDKEFGGVLVYSARNLYFQQICKDFLDSINELIRIRNRKAI